MFGLGFIANPLEGAPFGTALEVCLIITFVAWLLSVITHECSWIDHIWSLRPPVYCLTVADQQQWNFQQDKERWIDAGEDVAQQFPTAGLFRYSRHPKYFYEVAMLSSSTSSRSRPRARGCIGKGRGGSG